MVKEPTIEELKNFLGEYLELKGINTSSVFRCFSPTHEDKHPSMSFYKKGNICNCFACGEKYNIFSLVGMEYNLKGFKEQKEKVIELYKNRELIQDVNATIYSKKNIEVELNTNPQQKEAKEKRYPKLDYYYLECKKRISETDYLQRRGISIEVQDRYNIGYDPNFKNNTWKAIIIPTTHYSFTARNTDINSEDRLRKVGKSEIFNYWELEQNKKENFYIVEGEIDALSIAEVGKKAIALGSVNNINLFINKLKNDLPGNKFYLMLDNDGQGIKAQEELYNKMKDLNLNVENTKVLGKYKDPNEFLVADRDNFMKALNELEINKVITMEVDKLYSYDLESKQLIKEAPFNDIGLAEVYESSQELYKNNISKNITMFGVNNNGEIFFKKTKDIDFNSTKERYVSTYNIFFRENKSFKDLMESKKEEYLKNIRETDAKLNTNFEELVFKVNNLELEKIDIPISSENKNIEKTIINLKSKLGIDEKNIKLNYELNDLDYKYNNFTKDDLSVFLLFIFISSILGIGMLNINFNRSISVYEKLNLLGIKKKDLFFLILREKVYVFFVSLVFGFFIALIIFMLFKENLFIFNQELLGKSIDNIPFNKKMLIYPVGLVLIALIMAVIEYTKVKISLNKYSKEKTRKIKYIVKNIRKDNFLRYIIIIFFIHSFFF